MPWKSWTGWDEAAWPSRGEAVVKAFAIFAAEVESTTHDLLNSILGALEED